ncbi:hypothetical protein [Curtobacterium sp. L1-20]|uniref:hypothetical protein n=1 Tax=Curtobacterium sp. L1-20 TaxID=3138181 RepID=UPI003B51DBB6
MRRTTIATAAAVTALAAALVALPGVATAEGAPTPTPTASQQAITGSAGEAPTTKAAPQSRAATPIGTEWVGAADVTPWTTGAFPSTWFTTGGTPTFGASGATLPAATLLAHATTGSATTDLTDVRSTAKASEDGLGLGTADLIATGDARYALVVDTAGSTDNATGDSVVLTTSATGPTAVDGTWTATVAVGTIAAGTPATLADFQAQFAATTPDATINAYGALTVTGSGTVTGISRNSDNTYFTPEPTGTIRVQTPTTQSSLRDPGVRVTATGFLPGEEVQPAILLQDLEYVAADQVFTADEDGNVSGTATFASSIPAGDVVLTLSGADSGILVSFPVTVVADPATPGTDPETPAPAPVAVPVPGNAAFTG